MQNLQFKQLHALKIPYNNILSTTICDYFIVQVGEIRIYTNEYQKAFAKTVSDI